MQPLSLDRFDLFILKQLFPNFKLSIEQIMKNIEKQLLKELESLSKYAQNARETIDGPQRRL